MGIEILGLPMMYYIAMVAKVLVAFVFVLLTVAYATYAERKIIGHMQVRLGPMRVGWHGLLQPIADGVKLFFKEEIIPTSSSTFAFLVAPLIALIPAFITFAVIPFGGVIEVAGYPIPLQIASYIDTATGRVYDLNVGALYILAMSSLGVYGIVLAGWASNSKYSLMGGLRASAQMISYELSAGLAIVSVFMLSGTLSLNQIVNQQAGLWYVFKQPLAFFLFFICSLAEINRTPFDLPEAETELVSGFCTEYSSMKYAMFFMAEYANMVTVCALTATLFLGGWQGPLVGAFPLLGPVYFIAKVYALIFVCMWIRATLPRYRYDQLMHLGWKVLLPLSLVNIVITGVIGYFVK
ncbi:NADH-quinone oxidoreductase subunit NuoH [Geobacter sp. SVR]|uniref:NADH-quinone oxidoreductase subunit NuoH n=1 Tax=Geobacter sp. SVR TaxID=2495594 RepID=UPI00143EFC10|nr:NADH-quinone oxidoreductase subunit NuoH [Geobacter sp. SVR]BCS55522.1 NADH-quinone oxidoreductase subunit H 1 [Geobacter sp. SVR]GCF83525.1 NADH-quinone oxidoreductase subunit H 1 [Geobacter sp. SVR]